MGHNISDEWYEELMDNYAKSFKRAFKDCLECDELETCGIIMELLTKCKKRVPKDDTKRKNYTKKS